MYTLREPSKIQHLDNNVKKRIGKALIGYREYPLKKAEKLTDFAYGTYKFRIGDYRIIFDIEDRDIVILRVGHRREIYKRK
ncbi:MAG: type II toxin-antitoxin system RelE family toxin [Candidatus Scalindua sp.]